MKKEISSIFAVAVIACVLAIAGFFFYRLNIAQPSYRGALQLPKEVPTLVKTPYGTMSAEQAAKASLSEAKLQPSQSGVASEK